MLSSERIIFFLQDYKLPFIRFSRHHSTIFLVIEVKIDLIGRNKFNSFLLRLSLLIMKLNNWYVV